MPRGATSKRAAATRSRTKTQREIEIPTVTVTTDTENENDVRTLPFEVNITPAPDDFKPDRSPAGRKRIPSPFEPILPGLKGKGWQNQPHDGQVSPVEDTEDGTTKFNTTNSVKGSNAQAIIRELLKAVKFLNSEDGGSLNLGIDFNVTQDLVQFNIRDKQSRKSRTPSGDESTDGDSMSDADDDDDENNGDE